LFGIYITDPDGIQKKIPFLDASGNTVMEWIPANSQNKRARNQTLRIRCRFLFP